MAVTVTAAQLVVLLSGVCVLLTCVSGAHEPGMPGGSYPQAIGTVFRDDHVHNISVTIANSSFYPMQEWDQPDVPANVTIDGQLHFINVGISYKGNWNTWWMCRKIDYDHWFANVEIICPKMSYAITFDKYDDSVTWFGVHKVSLNMGGLDRSMLRDRLGYQLFNDAGIVTGRAAFAQLTINGQIKGLYTLIEEQSKKAFIRDRFRSSEGYSDIAIFRDAWPVIANADYYSQRAATHGNDTDQAISFMVGLASQMHRALIAANQSARPILSATQLARGEPGHELVRLIDRYFNLTYVTRWLVMDRTLDVKDGPWGIYLIKSKTGYEAPATTPLCDNVCESLNYYIVHMHDNSQLTGSDRERLMIIPHDFDEMFSLTQAPPPGQFDDDWWNYTIPGCARVPIPAMNDPTYTLLPPRCDAIYRAIAMNGVWKFAHVYRELRGLLPYMSDQQRRQAPLSRERIFSQLDSWAVLIEPVVRADPVINESAWRDAIPELKRRIDVRFNKLDALMASLDVGEGDTVFSSSSSFVGSSSGVNASMPQSRASDSANTGSLMAALMVFVVLSVVAFVSAVAFMRYYKRRRQHLAAVGELSSVDKHQPLTG